MHNCWCAPKLSEEVEDVFEYDYIPEYIILDPKSDIRLGLEFEFNNTSGTETTSKIVQKVMHSEFGKFLVPKWDGSIGQRTGIEFSTQIISPTWIEKNESQFEDFFRLMLEQGCKSELDPSCGGHIHYSSSDITNDQLEKILKYFGKNPAQLRILSQRQTQGEHWQIETNPSNIEIMARSFYSSRYNYISFNNPDTVEFRFFSGISSLQKLKYVVSTAIAIMDFGKENRRSFRNFLRDNKSKYEPTWEYVRNVRNSL